MRLRRDGAILVTETPVDRMACDIWTSKASASRTDRRELILPPLPISDIGISARIWFACPASANAKHRQGGIEGKNHGQRSGENGGDFPYYGRGRIPVRTGCANRCAMMGAIRCPTSGRTFFLLLRRKI